MPQLAPINWMLLFILFWFIILMVSVLIWWNANYSYIIESNDEKLSDFSSKNVTMNSKAPKWNWN